MKVLMLTPDCQMIDRRILQEARTLTGAGHRVTLLAGFECPAPCHYATEGVGIHRFRYDWDDERLKQIRTWLPANDTVHALVNRAFMFLARRYFPVSPFERFVIEQALRFPSDAVHVHDFPMLHAGIVLARRWRVPVIYDAHEMYPAQSVLPLATRRLYARLERKLSRRVDAVITVNDFIADFMASRSRIARPVVLHNCADRVPASTRESGRETLRRLLGVRAPVVLFQGWLSPERNLDTVLRAMRYVPPPVLLAIVGYGSAEAQLRGLVEQLGLGPRVRFLGEVPSAELPKYTVGADLGLIPYLPVDDNHRYCSPNKFFEYVAAGVPVLAHRLPFFERMQHRHGVVRCTDFASPRQSALDICAALQPEAQRQSRENCLRAAEELNWDVEGAKLVALYRRFSPRSVSGLCPRSPGLEAA